MTRPPTLSIESGRLQMVQPLLGLMAKAASAIFKGSLPALFLALLYSGAALAQQTTISGNYAPFSVTVLKAAIAPPPGTVVLENGSVFYNNRDFVDSDGNTIRGKTSNVFVNRTTVGYVVPDFKILGADTVHFIPPGSVIAILLGGMVLGGLGSLASVGRFSRK